MKNLLAPLSLLLLVSSTARAHPVVLPAWETEWERHRILGKDTEGQLMAFRDAHPEIYGITFPPVQPVRFFAEYDPVDAIYYQWEPGIFDEFFAEITHEVLARGDVTVHILHHGPSERAAVESLVSARGDDPGLLEFIDVASLGTYYVWESEWPFDRSLESFWAVDYGPFFVEDGAGVLSVVDPRYLIFRVNDDAVPTKIASLLGVDAYRPDLHWEGGNLLSDGRGTCFATGLSIADNIPRTRVDIEADLASFLGCDKVIWLEPMLGDGTAHVDMFFKNASATTLLLGEYEESMDPTNAAILDRNAALLASETNAAGEPFEVLRIPMPDNADGVFRSYTNGIVVNDLVLVPTYDLHDANEGEALAVYETAFPGRTVVGIDAEDVITWGGAIHCVTRTRPVATHSASEDPPGYGCSGDWDCTPGCGDLDYTGECVFGLPVYCDADLVWVEMCWPGERCGWDLAGDYFYCVTAGCGALPAEGECRTVGGSEYAVFCDDGWPDAERCDADAACGLEGSRVTCIGACSDECTAGTSGCEDDTHAWACGEAGDGDECLELLVTTCDEVCEAGACTCADECEAGTSGCDAAGDAWTCGEAGDGDECLEVVTVPCPAGSSCDAGACMAEQASVTTSCGCLIVR